MITNHDTEIEIEDANGKFKYAVEVDISYFYDPGYWRNSNGDGCPPSSDFDYLIVSVYDYDGNKIDEPDDLDYDQLEEKIWQYLETID